MMMQALMGSKEGIAAGGSISATASPTTVSNTRTGNGSITTPSTTVTPSGGTAPYTYAWSLFSGASMTINSPTAATTTFTTNLILGQTKLATFRCIVTDNVGATGECYVDADVAETS